MFFHNTKQLNPIQKLLYIFFKILTCPKRAMHKLGMALKVFWQSILIRKKVSIHKKGLFIDCGANLGQGFEFFRKFYPLRLFDYVLFEPNPYCVESLKNKYKNFLDMDFVLYEKAVSTSNKKIKFFGLANNEGGKFAQGGSLIKRSTYRASNAIEVDGISFSDFLKKRIQKIIL